ncbi:hypothetical protein CN918_25490 [Priestia megaterium]|nr:hypothetical protein CN918_25490 [Priestia megaterium]
MKIAEFAKVSPARKKLTNNPLTVERVLNHLPKKACDCYICTKHKFKDGSITTYLEAFFGFSKPRERTFNCHSQLDQFIHILVNYAGWDRKISFGVYNIGVKDGEKGKEEVLVDEYHGELKDFLPDAM